MIDSRTFEPVQEYNKYMQRCIQLAKLGAGYTAPNPMVGCVIVHQNTIIGEGYHQKYGGPHAEVNAIKSVKDQSLLSDATVFVSLEPCSHFGKTPPCADLLIAHKVARVVIGNVDPNALVAGKGIEKLLKAGIEVVVLQNEENRHLNRSFFYFHEHKKPWITLKWAQTSDGYLGRLLTDPGSKQISSAENTRWMHRLRSEHQAILVGKQTFMNDSPSLDVRYWIGNSPVRLIIDLNAEILPESMNEAASTTYIFNHKQDKNFGNVHFVKIERENPLRQIQEWCIANSIHSVMVEGGAITLKHFLEENLWNEIYVTRSPMEWHQGVLAPVFNAKITNRFTTGADEVTQYEQDKK